MHVSLAATVSFLYNDQQSKHDSINIYSINCATVQRQCSIPVHLLKTMASFPEALWRNQFSKDEKERFKLFSPTLSVSPWYNRTGWLGVKHQLTYLLCQFYTEDCLAQKFEQTLKVLIGKVQTFHITIRRVLLIIPMSSGENSPLLLILIWLIGRRHYRVIFVDAVKKSIGSRQMKEKNIRLEEI